MEIALVYRSRREWPKFDYVRAALIDLGHSVRQVEDMNQLVDADRECDLVLFEHREPGPGRKPIVEFSKFKKSVWATWWFDLFLKQDHQSLIELYGPLNRAMDVVFVKESGCLGEYAALGINAVPLDQGVPDELGRCDHFREKDFDVVLFGSASPEYSRRAADVRALVKAGIRVGWAGRGTVPEGVEPIDWVHPDGLCDLMSRGLVTLCVDLRHDVTGYRSDRFWYAVGAGACVVKRKTEGDPKGPYLSYPTTEALVAGVKRVIEDREFARIMGDAAYEWSRESHTYRHRVGELLRHVQVFKSRGQGLSVGGLR